MGDEGERSKLGVAQDEIWKEAIRKTDESMFNWRRKYRWVVDECVAMAQALEALKAYSPTQSQRSTAELRTIQPIPKTTYGEIGWLVTRPEFALEVYGPYIKKIPMDPPKIVQPSQDTESDSSK